MSVHWITWAWEQDLPPTEKLTLVALCDHAGEDGVCWPSSGRLREKTGQGRSTILRHLTTLEERGLISREHRYRGDGSQTTSLVILQGPAAGREGVPNRDGRGSRNEIPEPSDMNRQEEPSPPTSSSLPSFDDFWAAYPKKKGKGEARTRWTKLSKADRLDAIAGAHRHGRYVAENPDIFVLPDGPVWLNKRRWEDDEPRRPPGPPRPTSRYQDKLHGLDVLQTMTAMAMEQESNGEDPKALERGER